MASIQRRPEGTYRARYRDSEGREHSRLFKYKTKTLTGVQSVQEWLDEVTASIVTGTYIAPKRAPLTAGEWSETWLRGYAANQKSTVRQARSHVRHIDKAFGRRLLSSVRSSEVEAWTVALQSQGLAVSTVYALHSRLSQIFAAAVHDGLVPKAPVGRRTSSPAPEQRPYVATTEQVWALHDAMPEGWCCSVLSRVCGWWRSRRGASATST